MSSNIPTRRVTRVTRTTTQKEAENANARPSRMTTRAKPPSTTSGTNSNTGVLRGTISSRAKATGNASDVAKVDPAAHKRKREALGEVTSLVTNNKPKAALKDIKGKDKEVPKEKFDGVVLKARTSTAVVSRQPLRTVSGTAVRRITTSTHTVASETVVAQRKPSDHGKKETIEVAKDEPVDVPSDDSAMAIDHETTVRASRRSKSISKHHVPEPLAPVQEEDGEVHRVFKKRRTSSEAPEDPVTVTVQEAEFNGNNYVDNVDEWTLHEVEADPNGNDWDDLDAEDGDDPLMVSEYVVEIFEYLRKIEQTTMPNPNYMESQKELAWKMRGILTDWLVQVHVRFRLLPETLYLCVNIIDRFLSARVVSLAKLQLVGVTCMFIAAKVEEIVSPSVTHFLHCADASYTESEILQAERYVLKTLDWNLSYPNPIHFLRRISKADDYDTAVRTVGKYLLEIGCLEWRLIAAPPSLLAAAAAWLARLILIRGLWTPNLAHYAGYAESQLVPTANLMLNYVLKPIRHESFHKKYAGKRYMKSSIFVREWALERWPEGTQVSLAEELPALKAANRAITLAQEQADQEEQ